MQHSHHQSENRISNILRRFPPALLAVLLCVTPAGCGTGIFPNSSGSSSDSLSSDRSTDKQTATIFAMDTVMDLTVYGEQEDLREAQQAINHLEGLLSVTDENSEIYRINHSSPTSVSPEVYELLERTVSFCEETDGSLDITIYPVLKAWGFTTGEYHVPDKSEVKQLLELVDYTKIVLLSDSLTVEIPEGMELDLGSVAKGYTGDTVLALLKERGVTNALLNLGGNVQALGTRPDGTLWNIGIRDPLGDSYVGAVSISDLAVVTSGGYERYFEEDGVTYSHIMDPKTGHPAESGLASVTVIGSEGMVCDAMSTALFVMGLEDGIRYWRENGSETFDVIFVTDSGDVYVTEGIASAFTLLSNSRVKSFETVEK